MAAEIFKGLAVKTLNKQLHVVSLALLATFGTTGCLDWWPEIGIPADEKIWGELNPIQGMTQTPAIKDQQAGMRYPAPANVSVNHRPYPVPANEPAQAAAIQNPVAITDESLRYGQLMYETTCIVCHGPRGQGLGYIIRESPQPGVDYPQPPSLTSARVRSWSDGEIYHVISNGTGRMWSYKNQLHEMERWAIVNYVRTLQRAEYPEPEDIERVAD